MKDQNVGLKCGTGTASTVQNPYAMITVISANADGPHDAPSRPIDHIVLHTMTELDLELGLRGYQGHPQCHHSMERLRNRNYASTLYRFQVIASMSKFAYFNLPTCIWGLRWVTSVEFRRDLWHQKIRVLGQSCGVIYVILHLAVLIQYRRMTYGRTHDDG